MDANYTTSGSNLGSHGTGIYSNTANGNILQFLKLLSANSNCSISSNSTNVILNCSGGGGSNDTDVPTLDTMQNIGSGSGIYAQNSSNTNFQFKSLKAGTGISITSSSTALTINNTVSIPSNTVTSPNGVIIGRWYGGQVAGGLTTSLQGANLLRATPFHVFVNMNIDQIEWQVTTLAAGHCRLGIYNTNSTLYPTSLVPNSDTGNISPNSTAVVAGTFSSPISLTANTYYMLAYNCDSAPSVEALAASSIDPVLGNVGTMGSLSIGTSWSHATTFGAMPSTYPAGAVIIAVLPPEILVHRSS